MPKPKKPEKKKPIAQPKPGQSLVREINGALLSEDFALAAELAADGMRRFPNNPDFAEKLAEALVDLKSETAALIPARRLLELTPNRLRSLHLAALVYYNNQMYVHASRCGRRFLEIAPNDSAIQSMHHFRDRADALIREMARRMNVSVENAEEGIYWLEEANVEATWGDNDALVIEHLRKALEKLPKSASARGPLTEALLKSGQIDEAERLSRETLKQDASDIDASWVLMLCARARYDDEALQKAYAPLKKRKGFEDPVLDPIQLARAHGMMEDHERAYELASQAAKSEEELPNYAHYVLGAAAANTGRVQEAKGYYRLYADHGGLIDLEIDSLDAGLSGPNVASSYPYFTESILISRAPFADFMDPILDGVESGNGVNGVPYFDLSAMAERYPQAVWIGEKLLFEENVMKGLGLLLSLGTERSLRIVREAAESSGLSWYARITSACALMERGLLKEGETLSVWNDHRRIEIGPKEIRALYAEPEMPEIVRDGIEFSDRIAKKDPIQAKIILQRLEELHPDIPTLQFNLALLELSDNKKKARLIRALELKPDYDYARSTLAAVRAYIGGADEIAEAEEILSYFDESHLFNPLDYVSYLNALAIIERAKRNYEEAIAILRRSLRENIYNKATFELLIRLEKANAEGRIDIDPLSEMKNQYMNSIFKELIEP